MNVFPRNQILPLVATVLSAFLVILGCKSTSYDSEVLGESYGVDNRCGPEGGRQYFKREKLDEFSAIRKATAESVLRDKWERRHPEMEGKYTVSCTENRDRQFDKGWTCSIYGPKAFDGYESDRITAESIQSKEDACRKARRRIPSNIPEDSIRESVRTIRGDRYRCTVKYRAFVGSDSQYRDGSCGGGDKSKDGWGSDGKVGPGSGGTGGLPDVTPDPSSDVPPPPPPPEPVGGEYGDEGYGKEEPRRGGKGGEGTGSPDDGEYEVVPEKPALPGGEETRPVKGL